MTVSHEERMQKKKAVVDGKIASAQEERGVLVINTGNGKGKSSAAFGVVARALGHGLKVGVVQFVKGRSDTGEEAFFRRQEDVQWHVGGEGFTWDEKARVLRAKMPARDVPATPSPPFGELGERINRRVKLLKK